MPEAGAVDAPGAAVVTRDVVRIEGPDVAAYLQGQVSQDVSGLAVGGSAWSFALQPQGKVDAWFRLSRLGDDAFEGDVDAGHGEALKARLQRFLLRTKAELSLAVVPMVAVRGTDQVAVPEGARAADPSWPGVAGVDLLGADAPPEGLDLLSGPDLERRRIQAGVPAMGAELDEATIPAETGVVERSVSFTKGCFTGQELVARIDSRGGNVPRHLRLLVAVGPAALAVGAEVRVEGDTVGTVTSSDQGDADRPAVALAYIARRVEPGVGAVVDGIDVRVLAPPSP